MSQNHDQESHIVKEASDGLFKSSDFTVQKFSELTNSAVSEPAVDHVPSASHTQEHVHAQASPHSAAGIVRGYDAGGVSEENEASEAPAETQTPSVERSLEAAEKCMADLESAVKRAEDVVSDIKKTSEKISIGDELRERIRRTIARTQELRRLQR